MPDKSSTLWISKKELARKLDCSLTTLDRIIDRYPDFPIEERGSNGIAYKFDLPKVDHFLSAKHLDEANAAAERFDLLAGLELESVNTNETGPLSPSQQLAAIKLQREMQKLRHEEGFLIDVSTLRQTMTPIISEVVQFLDGMPDRLGRRFNLPIEVTEAMRADLEGQRCDLHSKLMDMLEVRKTTGAQHERR